jgi:large subunit ribosomal protein L25
MELTLECKKRPADSKPNALRRSGLIPAVLYGHNGAESVDLAVQAKTAELLVRDASLNNTLITINVADLPWSGKALLREIQTHPWKGTLYHLSFFSIGSQASLDADVPIHVVGESPGVKTGGGSLDQVLTSLHVRCAPDRIPEVITLDISNLTVGGAIHVGELPLPEGVIALAEKDQIVLSILGGSGGSASTEESDS